MSGTPRWPGGIAVLPAGSVPWHAGGENTLLNPPPESIQPISAWPSADGAWQLTGGRALSTVRVVVLVGSVQRYVPPTPVTSGSEAGQETVGCGIVEPP